MQLLISNLTSQIHLQPHQHGFQLNDSYNEYGVPRRVLWGDTTTDQESESPADDARRMSKRIFSSPLIKEPRVGGGVCELQEITRTVVSLGGMAKQQQLSNSIILI